MVGRRQPGSVRCARSTWRDRHSGAEGSPGIEGASGTGGGGGQGGAEFCSGFGCSSEVQGLVASRESQRLGWQMEGDLAGAILGCGQTIVSTSSGKGLMYLVGWMPAVIFGHIALGCVQSKVLCGNVVAADGSVG